MSQNNNNSTTYPLLASLLYHNNQKLVALPGQWPLEFFPAEAHLYPGQTHIQKTVVVPAENVPAIVLDLEKEERERNKI